MTKKKETYIPKNNCDSIFTIIHIYGAPMMIFANVIYLLLYALVCVIYALNPKICRRAYDKSVLIFTLSQMLLSLIIIIVGYNNFLCHKELDRTIVSMIGIAIMILVVSSCFWLLMISLEVANTITKIRWSPSSSGSIKNRDENHKFRVYASRVVIFTMIPATLSAIFEFSPLPDDHILKPQFYRMNSLNYRVIIYVSTLPILIGVMSNVLFIYTTAKMMSIRASTDFAFENHKNDIKRNYIVYLKLYLFMDAPYVTGALGSMFESLWILKFCRLIQPILMLYAVLPREMMKNMIHCKKKGRQKDLQNH